MSQKYKWTRRLSLLTIPLLVVVVLSMGAGHGSYLPAMFLFPFGLVSIVLFREITIPFVIIAILQYPVYGFVIDKVKNSEKYKWIAFLILFVHLLLAMVIIGMTGEK